MSNNFREFTCIHIHGRKVSQQSFWGKVFNFISRSLPSPLIFHITLKWNSQFINLKLQLRVGIFNNNNQKEEEVKMRIYVNVVNFTLNLSCLNINSFFLRSLLPHCTSTDVCCWKIGLTIIKNDDTIFVLIHAYRSL